jgi:hypothetical protein
MHYFLYRTNPNETHVRTDVEYFSEEHLPLDIPEGHKLIATEEVPVFNPPSPYMVGRLWVEQATGELEWRYTERPLTPEEHITKLQADNAQILLALVMNDLI